MITIFVWNLNLIIFEVGKKPTSFFSYFFCRTTVKQVQDDREGSMTVVIRMIKNFNFLEQ